MQSLLYQTCTELNRIGGHALQRYKKIICHPCLTCSPLVKTFIQVEFVCRTILSSLTTDLYSQLLLIYNNYLSTINCAESSGSFPFCQTRALQLLFDVKFINLILSIGEKVVSTIHSLMNLHWWMFFHVYEIFLCFFKDKKSQTHYNACIELLESKIDPFDLDVFSPYIQANLNKHVQRCQVFHLHYLYLLLLNMK